MLFWYFDNIWCVYFHKNFPFIDSFFLNFLQSVPTTILLLVSTTFLHIFKFSSYFYKQPYILQQKYTGEMVNKTDILFTKWLYFTEGYFSVYFEMRLWLSFWLVLWTNTRKKKHKKIFVYFFNFQNYQNLFNPEIKKNKYSLIFLCNEIETRDKFISIFHNLPRIWKRKHYCKTKKEKGFRKKSCSSKTPNLMIMKFHFHEKLFVRLLSSFYNHRN